MKKFLTFLALVCLTVTGAWADAITTNQLFGFSTPIRGAWIMDGTTLKGTKTVSATVDASQTAQQFAIYEYDGKKYLWSQSAQHFLNNDGQAVPIYSASPIAWTEQDGGTTYFFKFTDAENKNINLGGSGQITIDEWSTADPGNKMTLTAVEGFDATAVANVIATDLGEKTYTVTVTGTTDGRLIYNETEYANNTSFNASSLTLAELSAKEIAGYSGTVSLSGTTITVTYTAMPFTVGKTYRMTLRNKSMYYDATTTLIKMGSISADNANGYFQVFGNAAEGYAFYSVGADKYFKVADITQDNAQAKATATDIADATRYEYVTCSNSAGFTFMIKGSTNNYINERDNTFSTWKSGAGKNDAGGAMTFTEVESINWESAYLEAKTAATTFLTDAANIPVLYTAEAISAANTGIAGITYTNTQASVNAAIASLNSIMGTFYKSAEGKKFTYASWMNGGSEQAPRYMEATTAAGALTTSTTITLNNIFELENVSGNTYKVKALAQNAYLNQTNTAAEGSLFNLIYQGSENYISLQFNGTTNAIHHQASGNKPVSWGTSSDASKWHVTAISDEEYNDMAFGIALKAALDEAANAYAVNDAPLTATDKGDNLITEATQFTSPYTTADSQQVEGVVATEEQVYSFLLDGNVDTYWHSQWATGNQPAHKHYLQVNLTEPISGSIQLTMNRRKTNADQITKMSVEYSTDNSTYTLLPGYMTFPAGTNGEQIEGTFHLPTNAQYIRFYEEETTSNRGYWHCSEFQLNEVTASKNTQNAEAAAALQAAIATAQATTTLSQATIDDLQAAIETYKATMNPVVTYNYYLTDENGDTYTGSFDSDQTNPEPTITGVEGYSLSNKVWGEGTFSADITFPFPVNTPTAISNYKGNNGNDQFWWRAAGTDIVVKKGDAPIGNDYAWTIIPALAEGAFTFTFKSVATEKYVKVNATGSNHNQDAVTLDETANATSFTYTSNSFQIVGQTLYLSVNSSNPDTEQYVGVHNAIHNGSKMHFGEIASSGLEITIGATGYATFYDEVNRAIPEGVKAYYCNYNEGTGNLDTKDITEVTGLTYIPAYVGVVLEGESGDYTLEEVAEVAEDYDAIAYIFMGEDGMTYSALSGTVEEITLAQAKEDYSADNIYVLSKVDNVIGFYQFAGATLGAHKAFYAPVNAPEINGFALDFGGQTVGVNTVLKAANLKAGFDIQGRRINSIQKGINILNGKKIIK